MRTHEEQICAVEQRIAKHEAKRRKNVKIAFSCLSVLLVVTASISAVLISNSYNNFGVEKDGAVENYVAMDTATDFSVTGENITEFEIITATTFYGNIVESKRSEADIYDILGEKNEKISAYEDTNYIYFFYPDGRLHRMQNISEYHNEIYLETDNEGIKEHAEDYLKRYIPYFDAGNYEVSVEHTANAYPAWHLKYTIAENGIIIDEINIRFLDNGELYFLSHQTCTESTEISTEKAVDIALEEIKNKFEVDIPDTENCEISVFVAPSNEGDYFNITVSGIPYEHDDIVLEKAYFIKIDTNSGAVLSIGESR